VATLASKTRTMFSYSRNPMYLGMLLLTLGVAVLLGRVMPFMVPALLFLVLSVRCVAHEEQTMTGLFGDEYARYCARVRRWL